MKYSIVDKPEYRMAKSDSITENVIHRMNSVDSNSGLVRVTNDHPQDFSVKVQEADYSRENLYTSISVRHPTGIYLTPKTEIIKICEDGFKEIFVGLNDNIGRQFSSLVDWKLSSKKGEQNVNHPNEILTASSNNESSVIVIKNKVGFTAERGLVASLYLKTLSAGVSIISYKINGITYLYTAVEVLEKHQCEPQVLEVTALLDPESSFYRVCSDVTTKLFHFQVASLLDVPHDKIEISDLYLDDGRIVFVVETDKEKENKIRKMLEKSHVIWE
eukprot:UN06571